MSGVTVSARDARVLIVDNYDSYTGNLLQQIWSLTSSRPHVVANDEIRSLSATEPFTHIVIGPGPGSPHVAQDVGSTRQLIESTSVPVLGVCLGHQILAVHLGHTVDRGVRPMHGRASLIEARPSLLFEGISTPFTAMRYHSLAIQEPALGLNITARAIDDNAIMAIEDVGSALYGVQFHPESVGTAVGTTIVNNFLCHAPEAKEQRWRRN